MAGKDHLSLKFLEHQLFKSPKDNLTLEANYTVAAIPIPQQFTSEEEKQAVQQVAGAAESSMIFSLVVPLLFMVFMSVSINRVWGMYNSLQLLSNFSSYDSLLIPPASFELLQVLKNVSYFNLLQNEQVQLFLRAHVFT